MGLDLTLMPIDDSATPDWGYSLTLLECGRRRKLFEAIMAFERASGEPVPKKFQTYLSREGEGPTHYGDTQTTPYGEPLTCLRVEELRQFEDHNGVVEDEQNSAVWAYLGKLRGDVLVALYWH